VAVILTLALGTALPSGPWTEPSREAPPDSDWATAVVAPGPAARSATRRRGKYLRIIKVLRKAKAVSPARTRPPTTSVDADTAAVVGLQVGGHRRAAAAGQRFAGGKGV
jgi:hypothetical protein